MIMAETQLQRASGPLSTQPMAIPVSGARKGNGLAAPPLGRLNVDASIPVNQNGSFEFDRVIKSGPLQKRTRKTKVRDLLVVIQPMTYST